MGLVLVILYLPSREMILLLGGRIWELKELKNLKGTYIKAVTSAHGEQGRSRLRVTVTFISPTLASALTPPADYNLEPTT